MPPKTRNMIKKDTNAPKRQNPEPLLRKKGPVKDIELEQPSAKKLKSNTTPYEECIAIKEKEAALAENFKVPQECSREATPSKKIMTMKFNGSLIPIDPFFDIRRPPKHVEFCTKAPENQGSSWHVYQSLGYVYSKTQNQFDLKNNNNKFYIFQILENSDEILNKQYVLFFRWGRVGQNGWSRYVAYKNDSAAAILEFSEKLEAKTIIGKYVELKISYENEKDSDSQDQEDQANKSGSKRLSKSKKLDSRVEKLVNELFDDEMIQNFIEEIGYDREKVPLGKLSFEQINDGRAFLKEIEVELKKPKKEINKRKLEELTNKFYSHIPHNLGNKRTWSYIIVDTDELEEKFKMLKSLESQKITMKTKDSHKNPEDKLRSNYVSLNCDITPVEKESETFKVLDTYMQTSSQTQFNKNPQFKVDELYEIIHNDEKQRLNRKSDRKLLFMGLRVANTAEMLTNGLQVPNEVAPITGQDIFGRGIYLTDVASKAAKYCQYNLSNNHGFLLICEVDMGKSIEYQAPDTKAAETVPNDVNSIFGKGVSRYRESNVKEFNGAKVPMGPLYRDNSCFSTLMYNEYVMLDNNHIKIKYLAFLDFNI